MTTIEIFQKNHRTIRKALVSLDRALLMQGGNWSIAAKNLANYLDIELRAAFFLRFCLSRSDPMDRSASSINKRDHALSLRALRALRFSGNA